ncbi:MAG TPA: class I SAM-dependent methyltransferase [Blastocatellia bacterium]|nr:class I SAM-dependent methyltransferase [Blastocatellia bacterium]
MRAHLLSHSNSAAGPCDLCGEPSARELYNATDRLGKSEAPFTIAACNGCGVLRTLPEMTDEELAQFYPSDYWGNQVEPDDAWIRSSQRDKGKFLRASGLGSGRILDVGCGSGWFLRVLDSNAWDRFGIENGREAKAIAEQALGRDRVFPDWPPAPHFSQGYFDVVTFWSALEHMNQPRASLEAARRIIKPGGTLIVQLPNAGGYQARVFKGNWFALDAPRHRYHFSLEALNRLMKETGFETYRATQLSSAHNAHALRQSLKTSLKASASWTGYAAFCLAIPLVKPIDLVMTLVAGGATLTVAAHAV